MANQQEEDQYVGKALDWKLMKRLLGYVKPYQWLIAISVIMMLIATGSNLARPYLIKIAIDSHMTAFTQPMVVRTTELPDTKATQVHWHGETYIRTQSLTTSEREEAGSDWAQLLHSNGQWYLVTGPKRDFPLPTVPSLHASSTSFTVESHGEMLHAVSLSASDIQVFQHQDVIGITRLALLYLAALLLAFGLNYAQTYMIGYAVQRIINDLRAQLFTHLQRLNLAFFDKNPVGRLVTRVMNDCQTVNDMFANVMLSFFQDLFTLVGVVIVLLQMNVSVALVSFVVIPFILLATTLYREYARDAFRTVRVKLAVINATLAENISGMRIIHMFFRHKQVYDRFHDINKDYLRSSMREMWTFALFRPAMDFLYYVGLTLVLWFGGFRYLHGAIQIGVLYAFTNYVQQFFQPIQDLSEKYNLVQQAMASSERIFELLDNDDKLPEVDGAKAPDTFLGRVEFRNVWFAYVDEEWVLRDVNFVIEPGQTVAFVGATGAGKSSILSLISRFYDVQKGQIFVDGINVRDWPLDELRRRIGVVLQDVFLFSGTVEDNIRLGKNDITPEGIRDVIRYVNAEPFIQRLPGGLRHRVQERGATFSSGQRQLIAFARALAFNPGILVLDEATANIDTETEQWIQDALEKLTRDRTTIVVAHRLSTIQHADHIVVLHKGRVREQGNHQTLLQQQGLYWNLYRLQYQDQEQSGSQQTVR